jgi:phosphomannomutase
MIAPQAAKSLRISHVGLRGVVGSGLTASHVLDFAAAFGTFLEPGGAVVIGRDPRARRHDPRRPAGRPARLRA